MASLVVKTSLSKTLDNINEHEFYGRKIPVADREEAAKFIASRQGKEGAYRGTFALFPKEIDEGIRVFTGERMTHASARHIAGEEAARALVFLKAGAPEARAALKKANEGMASALHTCELDDHFKPGMFCCGKCSVSLWRNLAAGNLRGRQYYMRDGMSALRANRSEDGKWGRFPFWYTVLALSEIDKKYSGAELKHAKPVLERYIKPGLSGDKYTNRRRELARRAVEEIL